VQSRPFQGRFLREWLSEAEEGAAKRVRDAIRIGVVEGETIDKIVRRVRGTRVLKYKDGALEISRRSAEAMVRTAVTHTSNVATQATLEANSDILDGIIWVSTLDSRTTIICAGLDGKTFPLSSGPRPPAHINCRSTILPNIKGTDIRALAERPTFEAWLTKQPPEVQADILGATRLRLWKAGEIKLEGFTDSKQRVLTLEQLRARNAAAFEKAGV
jgi:SPP1 gp7 family putative phage head morphogenesis protein